jgi:hypothetical protein
MQGKPERITVDPMNAKSRRHLQILREIFVVGIVLVSVFAVVLLSQARPAQADEAQVAMLEELERLVNEDDSTDEPHSRAPVRETMLASARVPVRR